MPQNVTASNENDKRHKLPWSADFQIGGMGASWSAEFIPLHGAKDRSVSNCFNTFLRMAVEAG